MRINNPRSFIGGSDNNPQYNLVTNKQLTDDTNTLSAAIVANYTDLSGAISGVLSSVFNRLLGDTGLTSHTTHGYAYLTNNGKIDPSLIPSLAISQTRVIRSSDLLPEGITSKYTEGQHKEYILDEFPKFLLAKANQALEDNPEGYFVQQGDIFVVAPSGTEAVNTNIHGTYIVTKAEGDTKSESNLSQPGESNFAVERLSYDNGNIVTINGKTLNSSTQPGGITLFLYDILTQEYCINNSGDKAPIPLSENQGYELESTIFRLATNYDGGTSNYRFAFLSGGPGSEPVPYAQLYELTELRDEVNTISSAYDTNFTNINQALVTLSGVNGIIDSVSSILANDISTEINARESADLAINTYLGTNGDTTRTLEADGNLTRKLNQLRYELNARTNALSGTNQNVYELVDKVRCLADNSVLLKYVNFTWGNSEQNVYDATNIIVEQGEETPGLSTFICTYQPQYIGLTPGANINNAERIVAIYDENNQIVYPDIKVNQANGSTQIIIETEDADLVIGKTWSLLVTQPVNKINIGLQGEYIAADVKANQNIQGRESDVGGYITAE